MIGKISRVCILLSLVSSSIINTGCFRDNINCTSGSGTVTTQEIDLDPFQSFTFEIAGNVLIKEDSVQKVTVTSHLNVIESLNTLIRDNTWNINFNRCITRYDQFEVVIHVPSLTGFILTGSGNILTENTFHSDEIFIILPGSGNITMSVDTEILTTNISGSGNVVLRGAAEQLTIEIPGSGSVHAFDLETSICDISISGSGSCDVTVSDELDVLITGSGAVRCKGDPQVNSTIVGSGSVVKVD